METGGKGLCRGLSWKEGRKQRTVAWLVRVVSRGFRDVQAGLGFLVPGFK